jgi:hypothetical protein
MAETCPKCKCQLDLADGEATDCCCGFRIERREGQLVAVGSADSAETQES